MKNHRNMLLKNNPAKKYKVGDYVVILNVDTKVGRNKKFIPKYRGPYVVCKELGHDRYVIRDIENCQLSYRMTVLSTQTEFTSGCRLLSLVRLIALRGKAILRVRKMTRILAKFQNLQ